MNQSSREDILRKAQALLAKAMSSAFEAEADSFRAKANDLMDKYRIEQWELMQAEAGIESTSSLKPVRVDIQIDWWWNEKGAFSQALWTMFQQILKHCAVVTNVAVVDYRAHRLPCFGLESDISFAQMLFTDLYTQMASKIKPEYDPNKSLGENVYNAKEAGMKYGQIAHWAGHPEWITIKGYSKRNLPQYAYNGIMIRSMKKYAAEHGLEIHKEISLDAYVEDYCSAYATAVTSKLRAMRADEDMQTGSMALAIIGIEDLARELMYNEFEELRPHPDDCDCDLCHFCGESTCNRPRCKSYRSLKRTRGVGRTYYRKESTAAVGRGFKAGSEARIMSKQDSVGGRGKKELN